MNRYYSEDALADALDDPLSGDGELDDIIAAFSSAGIWDCDEDGDLITHPSTWDRMGAPVPSADPHYPTIDTLDSAELRLTGELMSLGGRLAERQEVAALSQTHELRDTFMAGLHSRPASPLPVSPLYVDGEMVHVLPPQEPRRVAEEVAAVEHMLRTAAIWMASVDVSTVSLEVQDRLAMLSGLTFVSALRFPHAEEVFRDFSAPPPEEAGASSGTVPQLETDPNGGPSSALNSDRRQRKRRRPRRN